MFGLKDAFSLNKYNTDHIIIIIKIRQALRIEIIMSHMQNLAPREMFNEINRSSDCGIYGYHIQKKYVDPLKLVKERQYAKQKKGQKSRKHQTKRGNFLDDEANLHKLCPGPGTYKQQIIWSEKQTLKRNYADKLTYIDQIVKTQKRQKFPAPGTYNVVKTLKEMEKQKKRLASRKIQYKDKINYLDQVQYQATQTPGVGNYNPRVRAKTETSYSKVNKKPEQWRKIHETKNKKKPQKVPDMTTYNPVPSNYDLFASVDKKKHNKNFLGKVQRLKTVSGGSGIAPYKYNVLQQWRGKDNSGQKKKQRHGLQSVSKGFSKSVYYN